MAGLFPAEYPSDGEHSERQLHEPARTLGDEWTIVYNVRHFAQRDQLMWDGEVDFIF